MDPTATPGWRRGGAVLAGLRVGDPGVGPGQAVPALLDGLAQRCRDTARVHGRRRAYAADGAALVDRPEHDDLEALDLTAGNEVLHEQSQLGVRVEVVATCRAQALPSSRCLGARLRDGGVDPALHETVGDLPHHQPADRPDDDCTEHDDGGHDAGAQGPAPERQRPRGEPTQLGQPARRMLSRLREAHPRCPPCSRRRARSRRSWGSPGRPRSWPGDAGRAR